MYLPVGQHETFVVYSSTASVTSGKPCGLIEFALPLVPFIEAAEKAKFIISPGLTMCNLLR